MSRRRHFSDPRMPHARDRGFTLVEVLVALAITGMLVTVLMGALHYVLMVREKLATEVHVGESDARLTLWFQRVIQGAVPVRREAPDVCVGKANELGLLTTGGLSVGADLTPTWVVMRLQKNAKGELELDYAENDKHQVLARWPEAQGRFVYVDQAGKEFAEWKPLERENEVAPTQVKLQIRWAGGAQSLVAVVRATTWLDLPSGNPFGIRPPGA